MMNVVISTDNMKTYTGLFDKICTMRNFKLAYKNAIAGKRHYSDVKKIQRRGVNNYLRYLLQEVKEKKYQVSEYYIFLLYSGHKWRDIYRLPMKDRIVQHAIMNYLEPIFRETFIIDTYSSIKTRGIHLGLQRVKKALRKKHYKYCLKLDIRKCYPSIDKEILKQKLAKKFKDNDLMWLLNTIINSCEKGLPIGNYTSLYFNNFYFNDFDHWIKEVKKVKAYFRYCDDIVILSNDKNELHQLFKEINERILELHVNLKANWLIFSVQDRGVNFLGYIIRENYVRLRKNTKINFISKISKIDLDNLSAANINILGSYWGIFKHADCRNLWKTYMKIKEFRDLNIITHKRRFVHDVIDIPIIVTNARIIQRKGVNRLNLECNYEAEEGKPENSILIGTSGELLIEAAKLFNIKSFPFRTTIVVNNNGFYEFT